MTAPDRTPFTPLRMRTHTIDALPEAMASYLIRLAADIEAADGDIVLVGLSVYPADDPTKWDVQVIVDVENTDD